MINELGAVALLIASEVQSIPPVFSQTLNSSDITVLAAFDTIADDESTSRDSQRTVQSRRRWRHHHQETQAFFPPYGFSVEWIGCYSQPTTATSFHRRSVQHWAHCCPRFLVRRVVLGLRWVWQVRLTFEHPQNPLRQCQFNSPNSNGDAARWQLPWLSAQTTAESLVAVSKTRPSLSTTAKREWSLKCSLSSKSISASLLYSLIETFFFSVPSWCGPWHVFPKTRILVIPNGLVQSTAARCSRAVKGIFFFLLTIATPLSRFIIRPTPFKKWVLADFIDASMFQNVMKL